MTLLGENGFEVVTVEAVALRAGVAKSTVYRRFPGKPELMLSVLQHSCQAKVDDVDTGSVTDDLVVVLESLHTALTTTDLGRALPAVVSAAARYPEVEAAHAAFVSIRRQVSLAAVRRGIERGELAADLDPDMLVDMVAGPVFHRVVINRRPVEDGWIRELVERAVRGCRPVLDGADRRGSAE
jgi:AcrR family transcriptional regulator